MSSLWLVSLAVDMGKLMTTKTELQRAADAAALAGASAIDKQNSGKIIKSLARTRAAEAAIQNTALQERSEAVTIDPNNDVEFIGDHRVKVTVHREASSGNPMTTIFARVLGISSLDLHADAIAEDVPITKDCNGVLPFAPNDKGVGGFSTACGSSDTLKTNASTGGNFHLLSFPVCDQGPCTGQGGNGGATLRCFLEHDYPCCVTMGDSFDATSTKPGNNVGPVRQGLQTRWDNDTDKRSGICYQNYTGNGWRVMPVPIVSTFVGLNGRSTVQITGFGGFFLLSRPTGNGNNLAVIGQFIDYVAPGVAGSNPSPPNAIFTIRLVE